MTFPITKVSFFPANSLKQEMYWLLERSCLFATVLKNRVHQGEQ